MKRTPIYHSILEELAEDPMWIEVTTTDAGGREHVYRVCPVRAEPPDSEIVEREDVQ
jgi:hypothetical protein